MAKRREKSDLPSKMCRVCKRPFSWRKKWERDWENVIYCSKRCAGEAKSGVTGKSREKPASSHRHT